MIDLSVIIPIYNEEKNIPVLIQRLQQVINPMKLTVEYVFINDGSRDNSIALIKQLSTMHEEVKYIDFSRNFGHQIAVTAGLDKCRGNAAVIIDADLQDPPELIADLYAKMKTGYEVVYAKRLRRSGESFFKKFTARIFYRLIARITTIDIPLDTGDFRIIHRKVIDVLKQMPEQQKYLRGQIPWIGFRTSYVEYNRDPRLEGETGYSLKKMLHLAIDGITSFSNFPLRFATVTGFVVSAVGFLWILAALYSHFITQNTVQGWTSMLIAVLFMGGIQLLSIGIIGEYISRMSANIRNRPLYVIGETNL